VPPGNNRSDEDVDPEQLGIPRNPYGRLLATIMLGRRGTPIPKGRTGSPKGKQLNAEERKDLAAFVRPLQHNGLRSDVFPSTPADWPTRSLLFADPLEELTLRHGLSTFVSSR